MNNENTNPENSQEQNNNGTIGREVDAENNSTDPNSIENEVANPDGFAENERHWPHVETHITPEEAEENSKNYPGPANSGGQRSHAENVAGTSEEDL